MTFKAQDFYFKKAKKEKFLARSVYKLEEIDKKYHIILKDSSVCDLGYYPGAWIQYVEKKLKGKGDIVGIDIQKINKELLQYRNVRLYQKDVLQLHSLGELKRDDLFDCVLSDMAPQTTGIKSVDQLRSLELVEKVFELLPLILKKDGSLVVKIFDGHLVQSFLKKQKDLFHTFNFLKPKSTRSCSKEFFIIAKKFKRIIS